MRVFVERLSIQMTMVLLRLCCSVVVTSLMAGALTHTVAL